MKIKEVNLDGAYIIEPNIHLDRRGAFSEIFQLNNFYSITGIKPSFIQFNQVKSSKNVLRGLHFQKKPFEQSKLINVSSGKILDVIVDIRKESKTYGNYYSVILSSNNNKVLYIPKGFAHGYLSLKNDTIVNYFVDKIYNPDSQGYIHYKDKFLNIDWGISDHSNLIISKRDSKLSKFKW